MCHITFVLIACPVGNLTTLEELGYTIENQSREANGTLVTSVHVKCQTGLYVDPLLSFNENGDNELFCNTRGDDILADVWKLHQCTRKKTYLLFKCSWEGPSRTFAVPWREMSSTLMSNYSNVHSLFKTKTGFRAVCSAISFVCLVGISTISFWFTGNCHFLSALGLQWGTIQDWNVFFNNV